jgi:hypothetical protein
LVITNGRYDSPNLGNLRGPAYDGIVFTDALEKYGNARIDHLPEHTAGEVKGRVESFLKSFKPSETAVLYFSCHGNRLRDGLWLAAKDSRWDRAGETAIEASWVRRQLHWCEAGAKVWILDCCHAAAGAYGYPHEELFKGIDQLPEETEATKGAARPARPARQGRGLAILAASSASQKALDGHHGSPYTQALVRGITTGDADLDRDGWVSADELAHYVHDLLAEELGDRSEELESLHFIDGAAGRIRLTMVIADQVEKPEPEPEPEPEPVPEPVAEKADDVVVVPPGKEPLRQALRDPVGPPTAVGIAVVVGIVIQVTRENLSGALLSTVLVGLLVYAGYVAARWATERLHNVRRPGSGHP